MTQSKTMLCFINNAGTRAAVTALCRSRAQFPTLEILNPLLSSTSLAALTGPAKGRNAGFRAEGSK
ncbi:hypothetical protein ACFFVJ_05145 [Roseibium salinum]|uniref:hypothetical protein n=1 Tax=Roseibium salinum TaxID=1604349 RepID=UPI0035EB44EC